MRSGLARGRDPFRFEVDRGSARPPGPSLPRARFLRARRAGRPRRRSGADDSGARLDDPPSAKRMSSEEIVDELSRRAAQDWELYRKTGESHELAASGQSRRRAWRREEGCAARWWERGASRFASASSDAELAAAMAIARLVSVSPVPPPRWPRSRSEEIPPAPPLEPPPDIFDELAREVSAESRGEAQLHELTLRRGFALERIRNGSGLQIAQRVETYDGNALAVGRRAGRSCEARLVFRCDGGPDVRSIARRLADRT